MVRGLVVGLVAPSSARARGVDLAIGRAQVVRLSPEWHDRPDVSRSSILGVALLALSSGCYQSHGLEPGEADAGAPMAMDAGRPWRDTDAGPPVDASVPRWDAAVVDAGALDAGVFDADAFDAAPLDAALLDASRQDGGRSDGGLDAGWDAGPDATVWLDGGVCGPGTDAGVAASPHTIDRYELRADATYRLAGMAIFPYRATHYLSDGTSWSSGAGSTRMGTARVVRIERVGTSIRYQLRPEERLLERTDYDGGDHSAHHGLDAVSELVLVAEYGGHVGTIHGEVRIAFDEPAKYRDERFHYLSAPVCSIVPFSATYTLPATSAGFTETLFDRHFNYEGQATVDFRSPRF